MNLSYKYIRIWVLATALMFSSQSCKVTDVEPINNLSDQSAFASRANILITMAGLYDAAQSGFYDPLNGTAITVRGYPFGAASMQQGDMRGADMLNVAAFFALTYTATYTSNTANNVNMWSTLFALINQSNIVIDGVKKAGQSGILPATEALGFEAEARVLRALAYHELLVHFARPYSDNSGNNPGLPIRDFPITSSESVTRASTVKRSTVAQTYTFILADLDFAETNGFARTYFTTTPQSTTRISKGAAVALKTRVKLHMQDWAGVITESAKLATGAGTAFTAPAAMGGYALQSAPAGAFASNTTTESIFSIENNAQDNTSVNGALGAMYQAAPAGRGLICISPLMWNDPVWLSSDLRRTTTALIGGDGRPWLNKFRDGTNYADFAPIIRYSEVLLNYAEAEAQVNGNTTLGVNLLNSVRNRAVTTPANQFTTGSFADATALLTAIYNERRIEFLGEGRAWPDLHRRRLAIPAKVAFAQATVASFSPASGTYPTTSVATVPYSDFKYLWPIPASEIANNPTLAKEQNPGW